MTDLTDRTDEQLLDRHRRGDHEALGQLLSRHERRLYNLCYRTLNDAADAAEACQEAMLKICRSVDGFEQRSRFSTWATRLTINEAISRLRRRRVRRAVSLNALVDPRDDTPQRGQSLGEHLFDRREPPPQERVQLEEELARLRAALASLDEAYRAVIVLRDIEQLDYDEIARTLDLPLGTVKSRLFRGRLALREVMLQGPATAGTGTVQDPGVGRNLTPSEGPDAGDARARPDHASARPIANTPGMTPNRESPE